MNVVCVYISICSCHLFLYRILGVRYSQLIYKQFYTQVAPYQDQKAAICLSIIYRKNLETQNLCKCSYHLVTSLVRRSLSTELLTKVNVLVSKLFFTKLTLSTPFSFKNSYKVVSLKKLQKFTLP